MYKPSQGNLTNVLQIMFVVMIFVILNTMIVQASKDKLIKQTNRTIWVLIVNTLAMILIVLLIDDIMLNTITYIVYFACVGTVIGSNLK